MSIARALETVEAWKLNEREQQIAARVVEEIRNRLEFLTAVGLELPEPGAFRRHSVRRRSAAHPAGDADRLEAARRALRARRAVHRPASARQRSAARHAGRLRDLGNTVLVVEHDAETIERADYVIDLGPGAGRLGGELVARGHAARDRSESRIAHRPVSFGRAVASSPRRAGARQRQAARSSRRARAQSEEHRRRVSAGLLHRGHRRFGQRKIDAGQRYSVPLARARDLRIARRAGRARFDRGPGA